MIGGPKSPDAGSSTAPMEKPREELQNKLTRRQFLGMAGLGLVGLAVGGVVPQVKAEVGPETYNTYEEGINALREFALNERNEKAAIFVSGGSKTHWLPLNEQATETSVLIPLANIQKALTEPGSQVIIFHTHPLTTMVPYSSARREILSGKVLPPAMGPSFIDIQGFVIRGHFLGDSAERISEAVVDPAGTWTYTVKKDHSAIRKILKVHLEGTRLLKLFMLRDDAIALVKDLDLTGDPRTHIDKILLNRYKLTPESDALLSSVLESSKELLQDTAIFQFITQEFNYDFSHNSTDESRQEYIRQHILFASAIGVTIVFVPHA